MMHQHDFKQHFLKGLGHISHKFQTIVPCLNMFCRGCSHVQGGEFLIKPAFGMVGESGNWSVEVQNSSPTSSGQSLEAAASWFGFSSSPFDLSSFCLGSSSHSVFLERSWSCGTLKAMDFLGKLRHSSAFSFMWLPWLEQEMKNCR